jgi:preprotein translocase SecE subunit
MSQDDVSSEISPSTGQGENRVSSVERFRRYLDDVRLEMERVSWPTWKHVRSTTFVVLFFTFAMTGFVAVVDSICAFFYRLVVER